MQNLKYKHQVLVTSQTLNTSGGGTNHLSDTPNHVSVHFFRPSQQELLENLFWAGRNLLTISISRPGPRFKTSSWQSLEEDFIFKFSNNSIKLSPPNPSDIDKIDKILSIISLVSDPLTRRIIQSRCLINPISFRHIYSYASLSRLLRISPDKVKQLFLRGLDEIRQKLNTKTWQDIKKISNN